jgi:hypothetical protein
MWVEKSKLKSIERKTFIKGKFKGKFIGSLDEINSDLVHENFYDIEILDAEIYLDKNEIKHYNEGEHEEYVNIASFITTLPYYIKCNVTENQLTKHYEIHLNDPKLRYLKDKDSLIERVLLEDQTVFGDLVGEISGYILHHDTLVTYYREWKDNEDLKPDLDPCVPTNIRTGREQKSGNYIRFEYHCLCYTKTYWGIWEPLPEPTPFPWWIIWIFLAIVIFGPLIIQGLKIIFPLVLLFLGIYLIGILIRIISVLFRFLNYVISFIFSLFVLFGFFSIFNNSNITPFKPNENRRNNFIVKKDTINNLEIISHEVSWRNYEDKFYFGSLKIYTDEVNSSKIFRNSLNEFKSKESYDLVLQKIHKNQKNKLGFIYNMFDSLNQKNNLKRHEFAEIIVSCIQDIPYTLILQDDCDYSLYTDVFIKEYLKKNKGACAGNVKFGIYSPCEFFERLDGDCDTRTLLLFTILNHYGFDVAILSSEIYRHSILGINLPYNGQSKIINGKKYVVWETTASGLKPGILPAHISNMRNWYPSLLNN